MTPTKPHVVIREEAGRYTVQVTTDRGHGGGSEAPTRALAMQRAAEILSILAEVPA